SGTPTPSTSSSGTRALPSPWSTARATRWCTSGPTSSPHCSPTGSAGRPSQVRFPPDPARAGRHGGRVDVCETVETPTREPTEEHLRLGLIVDLDSGFAAVVRCYGRVVYSVALRVAATPADAEDLAAEAFLRAFRALRGYDAAR